ncbi:MAG: ribosome-binding factor A [Rhodospirillaceae bacterium]|nr:ribosome-binding factor A [Rhodospirillaceae bacterium]|tara:strand:+ start:1489 stop:1878 length:390 start_codon:yes stop_codon:yes gene_type:complete
MITKRERSVRQLRVGEELRHILSEILARGDLRDPDLVGRSITVSEVRVSPDMRNATAFVLPLGGGEEDAVVTALGRAAAYLRNEVGRKLHLKYLPQLSFLRDTSFDTARDIDKLLADPAVVRDLRSLKQ